MTAALTETPAGTCWECGGPCLTYKGSEHGWRCRTCCTEYLGAGAAKSAAADARDRAKRAAKMRAVSEGGDIGRGGGGSGYGPHRHHDQEPGHQ